MNKNIHGNNIHIYAHVLDMKWIFLLIKQRYNSDNLYRHFLEPKKSSRPLGPPPLKSHISQWKTHKEKASLGREALCSPKGQRDADSSITREAIMYYSFFALNFLLLQCIQEAQYISLQRGTGGSILSVLKEYGRPRDNIFGTLWRKIQFFLSLCTFPNVCRFCLKTNVYTQV